MPKPVLDEVGVAVALWIRRIRLRHLQVLLSIAQHGSLPAAATALDIT